ncbi:phospholipase D family protein [Algoriphagus sp. A40]|uniref:phospholipase D family protein n=1 Tax=Algoriphagus sp. A40 TaxID=1945863 RepID=UPI0009852717|nr:phospholipase D family protein [Algoriphagus sp. A40]OOG73800.1 hypothetical protein B0E43_13240 [Algoriphagus sp. A40]
MSKFLTGNALVDAIDEIIWDAKDTLMIVSPYIKLDDHFRKLFDQQKNNQELHLILVFGKNEKSVQKSMNKDDFEYFKQFPKISIVYVPNLHAKYYGNESKGIITSINLYDYSFNNNIEFGVLSEQSLFKAFSRSPSSDDEAWETCMEIADTNEVVFINRPIFENKKGLLSSSKNYKGSKVLFDSTEKFYGLIKKNMPSPQKMFDYPEELDSNESQVERPVRQVQTVAEHSHGFCIRTGIQIKFNPKQPMSAEAWKSWNKFANENYPEKFCHKTGQASNGKTSMKNPILN